MDAGLRPTDWTDGAAVAETHVSVVFFVGDRAYKLLKPIRTDFLDHSTVERRQDAVRREVELNRRVAPDVYLGTAEVELGGPDREPVIVMCRMPGDRRLERLVAKDDASDCLRHVAKTIAALHAGTPSSPDISAAATPEAVRALWETNVAETRLLAGDGGVGRGRIDAVGALGRRYLAGRASLLEERVEAGLARDGHGDLQAADIFCLDDGPRILDCLAFDEGLRHGDVLSDVAFLAMDLERLGHAAAADAFMRWYREFSFELHPRSLEHYYVAYRALVRTKVALLRAEQGGRAAAMLAGDYLAVAEERLRRGGVRLALIGGPPGVGKSTLAQTLSDATGASIVRSDALRKEIEGLGQTERADASFEQGLYRPALTGRVYREMLARAGGLLRLGRNVILDASWRSEAARGDARRLAADAHADIVEVRADCPREVAADRIRARAAAGTDPSDADVDVADRLREAFEPWPAAHDVDTSRAVEDSVRSATEIFGPT
ncbi:MAG: AAA family ATPase [Miltoncostaeaceae bacterium]